MAYLIHCRKSGVERVYRVWSTVVDAYVTEDMTEPEIRQFMLTESIRAAIENFENEWPHRLERAHKKGTSNAFGEGPGILAPWDTERPEK